MQTPFAYRKLRNPGGIDRMSDVYAALARSVRAFGPISNPAAAVRNARREQHELARVLAQVDALEQRLATTVAPPAGSGETSAGRAA